MSFAEKFSRSSEAGLSVVDKILREEALVYGVWNTQPNGDKAYFVIQIDKPKHQQFKDALDNGKTGYDLKNFGSILYQGWGEPFGEIRQELNRKYALYNDS